jgi:thiol-disulfide isomerase/thioredoxin
VTTAAIVARIIGLALGLLSARGLAATAAAPVADLRPFTATSLAGIREANAGRPFVLAFWSLHCAPCKDEIELLASIHRKYPGIAIILVATDPPADQTRVARFLSRIKLGRIETWSFADDFVEKVRFSVDRTWRGELPKSYFFDSAHVPTVHSGTPERAWVEAWFAREAAVRRE